MRAVADEIVLDVVADPLEIGLQALALVVVHRGAAHVPAGVGKQRVQPRRKVAGRRGQRGVEIEVEADCDTLARAEAREVTKRIPADRPCHDRYTPLPEDARL